MRKRSTWKVEDVKPFSALRKYKSNWTLKKSPLKNVHMVLIPKLLKMCLCTILTKAFIQKLQKKVMRKKCCPKAFQKE